MFLYSRALLSSLPGRLSLSRLVPRISVVLLSLLKSCHSYFMVTVCRVESSAERRRWLLILISIDTSRYDKIIYLRYRCNFVRVCLCICMKPSEREQAWRGGRASFGFLRTVLFRVKFQTEQCPISRAHLAGNWTNIWPARVWSARFFYACQRTMKSIGRSNLPVGNQIQFGRFIIFPLFPV